MTGYDYKVIPAPKRAKKVKGLKGAEELFAHTLTEAINEVARQGWEYVRAESLPAEAPGGFFKHASRGTQTVLVFRRERETLGPRLAAARSEGRSDGRADMLRADVEPAPGHGYADADRADAERAAVERLQQSLRRREPSLRLEPVPGEDDGSGAVPTPLRPPPRLGPAEKPWVEKP